MTKCRIIFKGYLQIRYDTIGMAVDIWTQVTVTRSITFSFINEGEGSTVLPTDETNLVYVGLQAAFDAAGEEMPLLNIHCNNRIPFARGLGSSSAGIVAGIIAGINRRIEKRECL